MTRRDFHHRRSQEATWTPAQNSERIRQPLPGNIYHLIERIREAISLIEDDGQIFTLQDKTSIYLAMVTQIQEIRTALKKASIELSEIYEVKNTLTVNLLRMVEQHPELIGTFRLWFEVHSSNRFQRLLTIHFRNNHSLTGTLHLPDKVTYIDYEHGGGESHTHVFDIEHFVYAIANHISSRRSRERLIAQLKETNNRNHGG